MAQKGNRFSDMLQRHLIKAATADDPQAQENYAKRINIILEHEKEHEKNEPEEKDEQEPDR